MSNEPQEACGTGYVAIRDYFALWLHRLETYYDRRFSDLDTKTTLALTAADKAVTKAETATEKRFEGVNEFRGALSDQAANLMSRVESLTKFEAISKDLLAVIKDVQTLNTRATVIETRSVTWTTALGIFFTVLQISLAIIYYFIFQFNSNLPFLVDAETLTDLTAVHC